MPAVLVPNASDLTWAGVDLDPATVAALPGQLSRIPEGPARVVVWSAIVDAVSAGVMDPRPVLGLVESEWVEENSPPLLERVATTAVRRFVPEFLLESEHEAAWHGLAEAGSAVLATTAPESNRAVIAARMVAECSGDVALLRRWLGGEGVPSDLVFRRRLPMAAGRQPGPPRAGRRRDARPSRGGGPDLRRTPRRPAGPGVATRRGRETVGVEPGRRGELVAVQPRARRAAAGFLGRAGPRPGPAVRQPVLRRGPAPVGMGRRRRLGARGPVRVPPRGRARHAVAGRGGSGAAHLVTRDAAQHRRRRVRPRRGRGLPRAVCAGSRRRGRLV